MDIKGKQKSPDGETIYNEKGRGRERGIRLRNE